MNITDEMVEAGARLIAQEHGSTVFDDDHVPYEFTEAERSQYRAEARAVAEAVAPLIAAQALLVVDAKQGVVPFIDRGGVPFVEREHMFDAVNRAAEELFGDGWPAILRAEVERRRLARS